MATIKEVAAIAGVSVATVSYVLNDSRKVRPETGQRVLWAAKELAYLPNTAARSLMVGRSSIVGLIVPDIGNPFFPEITKSFQEEANLSGMETIVMNTNSDPQRTHLAALGHKRVGFIGGPFDGVFAQRRRAAFVEGASSAGLETRLVDSDFTVQGGYFSCSKLLCGFEATAVMAANDLMAIGAMHYAYDRQIPVPAALSVIGFDDITFAQFTQPALTTVAAPRAEIGRLAFQSFWKPINDSSQGGADYEVKTSLVIRQTTAPPPTAGREHGRPREPLLALGQPLNQPRT